MALTQALHETLKVTVTLNVDKFFEAVLPHVKTYDDVIGALCVCDPNIQTNLSKQLCIIANQRLQKHDLDDSERRAYTKKQLQLGTTVSSNMF